MSRYLSLLVLVFGLMPASALAAGIKEIDVASGNSYAVSEFSTDSSRLLIWLPSEYGLGEGYHSVGPSLAKLGMNVWALDIHASLMVPPGRRSLEQIELDDLVDIVKQAGESGFDQIFLTGSGRGARLAIEIGHAWQASKKPGADDPSLSGLILLSPQLLAARNTPGIEPPLVTISGYSNLPVYLLQPEFSTRYAHRQKIREQLQIGGSPVFAQNLGQIQDGFQSRPKADLTARDLAMRDQLATIFLRAANLLAATPAAPFRAMPSADAETVAEQTAQKRFELQAYEADPVPPPLRLPDLNQQTIDLKALEGQVVLVNFWATWCGPCVREIPSLSRLVDKLSDQPFRVLAVNINEPKASVEAFLQKFKINFDVLLDSDSQSVRDWNVYAYPSNFLIDQTGRIRYVYRGALEWDDEDVVTVIQSMFLNSD